MPDNQAAIADSAFRGPAPRATEHRLEIPLQHVRGGTSTGVLLYEGHLPEDTALREEAIRHIMGVPQAGEAPGDRQITGLGRGIPQSCKVFIVGPSPREDADIQSTLAQLAPGKSEIDWSVNCGNMSAALPFYADEFGLADLEPGDCRVRIHNTNTDVVTHGRMTKSANGRTDTVLTEIPGVLGRWPAVQLEMLNPAGAKTGRLLPTGAAIDVIGGVEASCVDLAVPMVILKAVDLGLTALEDPNALDANQVVRERLREIWVAAGLKMGLLSSDGSPMTAEQLARSETIPKICVVAPPNEEEQRQGAHIRVRYFTPQAAHKSMAVTGGACLAAACMVPGSTASQAVSGVAPLAEEFEERVVGLANPAGVLRAGIRGRRSQDGALEIPAASYERSAQTLMQGYVPIYHASDALRAWYVARSFRRS